MLNKRGAHREYLAGEARAAVESLGSQIEDYVCCPRLPTFISRTKATLKEKAAAKVLRTLEGDLSESAQTSLLKELHESLLKAQSRHAKSGEPQIRPPESIRQTTWAYQRWPRKCGG